MRRVIAGFTMFALLLVAFWVVSCSSAKKSPTAPAGITPTGELTGSLATTSSTYAHTFTTAGTVNYLCTIHSTCGGLQGRVVVVAPGTGILNRRLALSIDGGSAGGPYGGASCSALSFALDTVQVGDQVVWTNNSTLPHNVTSY